MLSETSPKACLQALHRFYPRVRGRDIFRHLLYVYRSRNGPSNRHSADDWGGRPSQLSFATPSFINQTSLDWLRAQENPQFQIEVGLANLSMGGAALAASLSGWGSRAYGMTFLIYGLYIACASLLHMREVLHLTRKKEHSLPRIANSVIFALALIGFAVIAFHGA